MDILLATAGVDEAPWLLALREALPAARVRSWQPGDDAPADYLLYWKAPEQALADRPGLKAVFNLGAGVDALLAAMREHPGLVTHRVPVVRLEDAGMARQMAEYALYCALRYQRRFDAYEEQARERVWRPLEPYRAEAFTIGVLGAGQLGLPVAQALAAQGFPLRLYSRTERSVPGIETYAGPDALIRFASGARMLVNLLPDTPATAGVLSARVFDAMAEGGYVVNLARGPHLVDTDLLEALARGKLARAALDVFREEPLPQDHPFWRHPRIDITPHISALSLVDESVAQIAGRIARHEAGEPLRGLDWRRGY
ncbi:Glyoxylate/hydroxypyruvate reductase A [Pigmentiphaga humi]|uniref:Glyoxylate/hydroxypyruvate reductase A n=1 Tax=Pigmentiphaga humi TaxID=2478468 RepID=A0A3P4AX16_9BURK|nr:glyoxylate/hydroxypyruvate reductase A [Pigmentiphaga humi]VCU68061.1 Glyoxylate/hydroxypyruvate reductase A [Pigmentiphaga humi]